MRVFLKMHFNIPKVTRQSLQSDHQVTQSHPQIPKLTPNWSRNHVKVTPKAPPYAASAPKVTPKVTQSAVKAAFKCQ